MNTSSITRFVGIIYSKSNLNQILLLNSTALWISRYICNDKSVVWPFESIFPHMEILPDILSELVFELYLLPWKQKWFDQSGRCWKSKVTDDQLKFGRGLSLNRNKYPISKNKYFI